MIARFQRAGNHPSAFTSMIVFVYKSSHESHRNIVDGREVYFLTGTDEHGQKVEQSALKDGKTPLAFAGK